MKCPYCGSLVKSGWDACPVCGMPIPSQFNSSNPQKLRLLPRITIPELEKPENARWLALLIDTEGAMGWTKRVLKRNRINKKYRHTYTYRTPYIETGMKEIESKKIVDRGAYLVGMIAYTYTKNKTKIRYFMVDRGRALVTISYMKPYLVKFKRMAILLQTLFRYHTFIPIEKFDHVITMLFGKYLRPKQANKIMLQMPEEQFNTLIQKAQKLTLEYLI